jgi:oligopeptide/dipeptide ABC transporter ATP-binding protein
MTSAAPLVEAVDLVKHFPARPDVLGRPRAWVKAVDGVSLTIAPGETLALVGESGCGKSTVGRLLLRLIEPSAGRVRFMGSELHELDASALRAVRRHMQIIFQDPYGSLNPHMTVGQTLAEPLGVHGIVAPAAREQRVFELLRLVGLRPAHAQRYPHEFSGGQRQRIGIARALAAGPKLIVCDEPVSALDVSVQAQVLNLLADLQRQFGLSYLFIAHDLAVVRQVASRVAVMYLGRIVEVAATEDLFAAPRHPYTQALLSAVPIPDPTARRERVLLEGDVPSALAPPPGCRFHTRCPLQRERCRHESPGLEPARPGHGVACHFWREAVPRVAVSAPPDVHPALARLQGAFAARSHNR